MRPTPVRVQSSGEAGQPAGVQPVRPQPVRVQSVGVQSARVQSVGNNMRRSSVGPASALQQQQQQQQRGAWVAQQDVPGVGSVTKVHVASPPASPVPIRTLTAAEASHASIAVALQEVRGIGAVTRVQMGSPPASPLPPRSSTAPLAPLSPAASPHGRASTALPLLLESVSPVRRSSPRVSLPLPLSPLAEDTPPTLVLPELGTPSFVFSYFSSSHVLRALIGVIPSRWYSCVCPSTVLACVLALF